VSARPSHALRHRDFRRLRLSQLVSEIIAAATPVVRRFGLARRVRVRTLCDTREGCPENHT